VWRAATGAAASSGSAESPVNVSLPLHHVAECPAAVSKNDPSQAASMRDAASDDASLDDAGGGYDATADGARATMKVLAISTESFAPLSFLAVASNRTCQKWV